ncbi:protein LONGIFOLIA 2-like [Phragmites australis]|uniref:protein LONGIFOLIA 2-like n=1 Tax=Phragmites australis TaxID=29695 RepID=UPI002D779261|nr:protein LONGIFOLIA 2-like [Phragmites australis]XP_062199158.1 protein LONGIFOLIA 2-like [Phragmites australis]
MPAKYLQAFGEERRPELHRQIGCVTGILQAFDRRHPLAAHKRLLPPGHALSNSPSVGGECTRYSPQIVPEKNLSKTWAENQKIPTAELSQTSYSSSPSSSFSSLDGNRSTQQDLSSTDRMLFPERPFKSSPKLKSSFDSDNGLDYPDDTLTKPDNIPAAQSSLPTLGIRNLVKDSIYKDSHDLSVRICTKEERQDHPFNCVDPPRQLDKPASDGIQGKSKGLMDINESLQVLAKLREASWTPSESGHHARLSYDAPRFSYDGKEAASKLREVPRLSLDIKEGHLLNREMDLRSKPSMGASERSSSSSKGANAASKTQLEQPACKRLPSVVAKLMGLEELPEHNENNTASSQAYKAVQESKQESVLSPLNISSHNEPAPQQLRNQDSTVRNIPNSKFPVETAPWKQQERIVLPRKLPKGSKGAHGRDQPAASVYSDIERRLKDLDFQQSNKDLRALKQILDSMQAKGLLQNKKREEESMLKLYDGKSDSKEMTDANMGLSSKTNPMWMLEESNAESSFKSPIVIMKPSKSANILSEMDSSVIPLSGSSVLPQLQTGNSTDKKKASMINRTAKEQHAKSSPRVPTPQSLASYDRRSNGRKEDSSNKQKSSSLLVTESSCRRQQLIRDNSMQKHKNSTSPRSLQKKLEAERRARPPIPSAESNKNQRQFTDRNYLDSVSPRSKFRRKPVHAQEGDDGMHNGLNSRTRSLNLQGNDMSTRSDGSMSVASELDIEVTSTDKSAEVNISNFQQGIGTPSGRNPEKVKTSYDASKDVSSVDPSAAIFERPSPVSVLDSSFDQEDLFPGSKTSNSLNADEEHHTTEEPWKPSDTKPTKLAMQTKNSKLANVASLLEKLQQLSVNKGDDAPPVDHIAFLCKTESPDHRYVSEILLASGLLMKDLGSGQAGLQLHSSGYPINPDLFLMLEQRKAGWVTKPDGIHQSRSGTKSDPKRAHRKLMFDAVNELLFQKFEKENIVYSVSSFTRVKDPPAKVLSGQQLVKFLSSGIEDQETERLRICQKDSSVIPDAEILHRLQGWTSFRRELPGMVLEIERSIFKELVDEVVHGESADGPQMKVAGRRRRRLFA